MFFCSVNNFRAIAIVCIVLSHCWWVSDYTPQGVFELCFYFFIFGGTFLFVFISGFLFQHLNVPAYSWRKLMRSKFKNVLCPYLFFQLLTLPLVLYFKSPYPEYFFTGEEGVLHRYVYPALGYLWSGRAMTGYWYIPFVMLVFVLSPVWVYFSKLRLVFQTIVILALFLVSGFVHRAVDNMNPLQALVYFCPVFLVGMVARVFYKQICDRKNMGLLVFAISVVLSLLQYAYDGVLGNHIKPMFELGGFDFTPGIKSIQAVGGLMVFERYFNAQYRFVGIVAASSFSIYFMHPLFIAVLARIPALSGSGFLYWLILSVVVLCACLAATWVFKSWTGGKSRLLIGS